MTIEQFQRKYAAHKFVIVPNVGPKSQGRYSVEIAGTIGVLGTCDTIAEAVTLADDYLTRPETHAFVSSADFTDCCQLCGENEHAHDKE